MARRLLTVLSLLACVLLGTAVDASAKKAKKAKAPTPVVKSVNPMKAQVGEKLTILGTDLKSSKGATKVYFLREGGGYTSAKPQTASKTRVTVVVPETIIALLRGTAENRVATRFQIRILAGRFGAPTKLGKSPLLTAPNATPAGDTPAPAPGGGGSTPPDGDCDGDNVKNSVDPDDDNDVLADDVEMGPAHTDPCVADTDGDKVGDGYEYYSAKDVNVAALPFPGKKPWPNPLDPEDAKNDHDGDGLTMTDEFLLWNYYGGRSVPLNYSDGLQRSVDQTAPTDTRLSYMDMDGDGKLSDDERDGDGDGLTNWDESHGRMRQDWWDRKYDGTGTNIKESRYPLDFPQTSIFDPDSDGDGVLDGSDDQDHDGLTNMFEVDRPGNWFVTYISLMHHPTIPTDDVTYPWASPWNPWARVQPYNPCKPVWSHTCHLHEPFGYYPPEEDWKHIPRADAGPMPDAPWLYLPSDEPPAKRVFPTISQTP
ncbi:MAG TPA: IPT/TIG domain-containing protein [Thermoleophilaceae bacterium]|jgi:hypothetical protein